MTLKQRKKKGENETELLNIKNYVKERKESLKKHSKGASITVFSVRDNPVSERYVRNKIKDREDIEQ